ncbi:DNA-3-methyladenine glycosylase (EC, partial [uncultured Gammaproteobacteria bacterium]
MPNKKRCSWVNIENKLHIKYHDEEWGQPVHNDKILFEMLILEGAQAGLSWEIVLNKRNNYKKAFDNFDPQKIAKYD